LDSSPSESSIFEPPSTIHHRLQLGRSSFPQLCTFLLRTCHSPAPPPPVLGSVLSCQPSPSVLSVPGPLLGLTYGTYLHQGRTKSGDVRACVRAFRKELGNATQRRKKDTRPFSHRLVPLPCRNRLSFVPGEACRSPWQRIDSSTTTSWVYVSTKPPPTQKKKNTTA
jgi:hypothetical protein